MDNFMKCYGKNELSSIDHSMQDANLTRRKMLGVPNPMFIYSSLDIVLTRALLGACERPPPPRFIEDSENPATLRAAGFSPT